MSRRTGYLGPIATVFAVALVVTQADAREQTAAPRGEAPASTVQLTSVDVGEVDGGGVTVTIRASGQFKLQGLVATADAPPRVFLDLPNVQPGALAATAPGRGALRRVRVAVNTVRPLVTRVVLDLASPVIYSIRTLDGDGSQLTVVLEPAPAGVTVSRVRSSAPASTPIAAAVTTVSNQSTATLVDAPSTASGGTSPSVPAAGRTDTIIIAPTPAPTLADAARTAQAAAARRAALAASTAAETAPAADTPQAPNPTLPRASMGITKPTDPRPYGRVSFYSNLSHVSVPGRATYGGTELLSTLTYRLTDRVTDGIEYGVDLRHSRFTTGLREPRLSVYDGYVGARLLEGQLRLRAGHMWLNDLGGLGALAGGLVEARQSVNTTSVVGKWRAGFFGGVEPALYQLGYEPGVRKLGGYVALDGEGARRHVVGMVRVTNQGLTERNALVLTNFLPIGRRVFVYQAAEYDVTKPVGQAAGGWSYFFTNARVNPVSRLEVQVTASRGRSLDVRGLSEDILAGRPVSQRAIDGLLYESLGTRVTVELMRGARVYAGYSRDRNNREDEASGRWLVGGFFSNLAGTGLDVAVSDSLFQRPLGSSYHSRYLSVGRMIGSALYLSGEYTTSLSVVRFVRSDGLIVEMRPATSRVGTSAVITLTPAFSVLTSGEYTVDGDVHDLRVVTGLNFRFQE